MVGLLFIALLIGIWLLVVALLDWDCSFGVVDFSSAELVLGEQAVRWLLGSLGACFFLIGITGVMRAM